MEKIKQIWAKYKVYILAGLLLIFFFRSCQNSVKSRRFEKANIESVGTIDSLNVVIKNQQEKINNFPEVIRAEKIKVHTEYDNYISARDRGTQLMELHRVVKDNLEELKK